MAAASCSSALHKPAFVSCYLFTDRQRGCREQGGLGEVSSSRIRVILLKPSQMLYPLTAFLGIFGQQPKFLSMHVPVLPFQNALFKGNKPTIFPVKVKIVAPFN